MNSIIAPQFGGNKKAPYNPRTSARVEVPVHKRVDQFNGLVAREAPFSMLKEFAEKNGIMHVKFVQSELERVSKIPGPVTQHNMEVGKFHKPDHVVRTQGRKTNIGGTGHVKGPSPGGGPSNKKAKAKKGKKKK